MAQIKTDNSSNALVQVIETAIKLPGVKVNRNAFLSSTFEKADQSLRERILQVGPVEAGVSSEELMKKAKTLVTNRTLTSSAVSVAAGLPGGIAMAATIPADTAQFFGFALRLAQEIAYLYGEEDLWSDGNLQDDRVLNSIIIYCGVMFGAGGAAATLRVLSSQLSKQALKKIPQMALTKTFYYPIVKSIAKALGVRMTKGIFGNAVSKAIPIVGGGVSGAITFATLKPMGYKLVRVLDEAKFSYTEEEYEADLVEIQSIAEARDNEEKAAEAVEVKAEEVKLSFADEIKTYKELLDQGVLTDEEFNEIKKRLIEKI